MTENTQEPPTPTISYFGWIPSVEQLTRWAQGIKSASVTLLAAGATTISGIGIMHAVNSDIVALDLIKVPAPFEERGFTSEITTTRLLDEIATYERKSSSAKDRVAITGKNSVGDLEKLQVPVAGVNVSSIQGAVQDVLGVKLERITGEITFKKDGDVPIYNVRLRRVPGNHVLLDIFVKGDPEIVLKQTALAMIEVFDPHIAASIYWRAGDEDNAMRLIDVVLNNDTQADDKYSLNLRGYIHITKKRFDAAKADFDRIMTLDPKFAPAHGMAAWLYRAQGQYDSSLAEADKANELAPVKWWGNLQRALTLKEMKRFDEADASFAKALALKPDSPGPYLQAAQLMASRDKATESADTYRKGLMLFPDNAPLHAGYADLLKKTGQTDSALKEYSRALDYDPKNVIAIAGKAELSPQPLPATAGTK